MFSLNDFVNSGFEFTDEEAYQKFRFRLLNSTLLVAVVFAFLIGMLFDLGLHDTGYIHSRVNYLYSVASIVLIIWLRQAKDNYRHVASAFIVVSLLVFSSALINVVEDEFRIIWFYLVVFVAYTTIDNKAGVLTTIASVIIIVLSFVLFELKLSQTGLQGAILGLIIASIISSIHVRKIRDYESLLLQQKRELEVLATSDGLTGVMNKRMFGEMSQKYIESAHRNSLPLSLLYLDLDYFKKVNDKHGHQVGDIMLIKFADVVGAELRKSDLLARIGGEEFAVVLFETNQEQAVMVAEKIRKKIMTATYKYDDKIVGMTTSIGISALQPGDIQVEDIATRADKALYLAKTSGRNCVQVYPASAE